MDLQLPTSNNVWIGLNEYKNLFQVVIAYDLQVV